ncbi:MAG: putative metallopeptidase [Candidatus Aenigmatarchaeota archaeon]
MPIRYEKAIDLESQIIDISRKLGFDHIDLSRVICVRSYGSKARRTLARCHTLPRIMQKALDKKSHYVIEVITESFDKLSDENKTKTLIHELMHIPKSFKGGFRFHDHVTDRNVNEMYKRLIQ